MKASGFSRYRTCLFLVLGLDMAALAGEARGQVGSCDGESATGEIDVRAVGRVVDADSGIPLPGAQVRVQVRDEVRGWQNARAGTTTPEGSFEFCLRLRPSSDSIRIGADALGASAAPFVTVRDREWKDVAVLEATLRIPLGTSESVVRRGDVRVGETVGYEGFPFTGRVTDLSTGRPIAGAVVELRAAREQTFTREDGTFSLAMSELRTDTLAIEHLGYRTATVEVTPVPGATVSVTAEVVPEPLSLEPIVVTAVRHRRLEVGGFYDRKEWAEQLGVGVFLTEDDIRQLASTRISHLVDRTQSVTTVRVCTPTCWVLPRMESAPPKWAGTSQTGYALEPCPADVYVNGIRARLFHYDFANRLVVTGGIDELGLPSELLGIEIYRRASELPAEFGGATDGCGAVALWTK